MPADTETIAEMDRSIAPSMMMSICPTAAIASTPAKAVTRVIDAELSAAEATSTTSTKVSPSATQLDR